MVIIELAKKDGENELRLKVWRIMNLIQAHQLFVHSKYLDISYLDVKGKIKKRKLPEILTLCVLNSLVPNSAMLLVGGHGGGKKGCYLSKPSYTTLVKLLGRMFTEKSLSEIEGSIVRGHSYRS